MNSPELWSSQHLATYAIPYGSSYLTSTCDLLLSFASAPARRNNNIITASSARAIGIGPLVESAVAMAAHLYTAIQQIKPASQIQSRTLLSAVGLRDPVVRAAVRVPLAPLAFKRVRHPCLAQAFRIMDMPGILLGSLFAQFCWPNPMHVVSLLGWGPFPTSAGDSLRRARALPSS